MSMPLPMADYEDARAAGVDPDMKEVADQIRENRDDPEWITAAAKKENYELEMFLSSDGKHTVRVKANLPEARKEAMVKAMEMYDYVIARYGTKQAQAVKEYGKNGDAKKNEDTCGHATTKFAQSKTDKNPGRWFKSCVDCGKFLGWQS